MQANSIKLIIILQPSLSYCRSKDNNVCYSFGLHGQYWKMWSPGILKKTWLGNTFAGNLMVICEWYT